QPAARRLFSPAGRRHRRGRAETRGVLTTNGDTTMSTDVIMPQMGESIAEGTIVKWLKQVGDKVSRDEPLFEISTDKVDAEIPSPSSGVLSEIKVQEGETVAVNTVVAVINGGEAKPAAAEAAKEAPKQETAKAEEAAHKEEPKKAEAAKPKEETKK